MITTYLKIAIPTLLFVFCLSVASDVNAQSLVEYDLATTSIQTVYCESPYNSTTYGGIRIGRTGIGSSELMNNSIDSNNYCNGSLDNLNWKGASSTDPSDDQPQGTYTITLYATTTPDFQTELAYFNIFWTGEGGELWNLTGTTTPTCSTCTRIISHTPDDNEDVGLPLSLVPLTVDYYVNTDDFTSGTTRISYSLSHALATYQTQGVADYQHVGSYSQDVPIDGDNTMIDLIEEVGSVGTYYATIEIYNLNPNAKWWQFWDDTYTREVLVRKDYYFYSIATTTTEDIQEAHQEWEYQTTLNQNEDAYWKQQVDQVVYQIKYSPPQGYAFLIIDMLSATTSTSTPEGTLAISMDGATGTPLEGLTISLDTGEAIKNAITTLEYNDMWNKFMALWNTVWYLMLAFWIIREVFGGSSLISGGRDTTHIKDVNMRKTNRYGTKDIDMRN